MPAPRLRLRPGTRPAHPGGWARAHRTSGFTLIEVMVALFILALMSAMAWQGIDAVVRSREVTQARMEKLLQLQTVMTQWETDLHEVIDTQMVPGLNFDGATLRMTRRQPDGVQVVAWTLRGGQLHRWASPAVTGLDTLQDAWMRSYQLLNSEAGALRMLDGVAQWQFFVFLASSNSWSNAQSSGDVATLPVAPAPADVPPTTPGTTTTSTSAGNTTPSPNNGVVSTAPVALTARDALPDGVRVLIQFGENGTASGTLTRETRLIHP